MDKHTKYLIALCIGAFVLRMAFVMSADGLAFSAYETIEQVRHIEDTGIPLISETEVGRYIPLPVFPYILAFGTLFFPDSVVYTVIPNLLAVLAHAALFYLLLELTGSPRYSLIGAAASVFIPAYLSATLLTVSSLALAIPLLIACVTLYLKLRKTKEKRNILLGLFVLFSFTNPIALICIPFLILSLVLVAIRDSKGEPAQQEFGVFAIFYLIWLYILLYKRFIGAYGYDVFLANAPSLIRSAVQNTTTVPGLASAIGVLIFGLALYATYKETAGQHIGIQVVIALGFSLVLAYAAQLMPANASLALLGFVCVALAVVGFIHLLRYMKTLRQRVMRRLLFILTVVLFVTTSVLPTVLEGISVTNADLANDDAIAAAAWIEQNTPAKSLLLAKAEWGFFLRTQANRPVYLTNNYFLADDVEKQHAITQGVILEHKREALLEARSIEYIVSDHEIPISCVNTVYSDEVYIAKVLCR